MWPLYQSRNNHLHSVFRHTGVAHTDDNASREQGLTGRTQKYAACTRRWTGTVSGREHPIPLGRRHNNNPPLFHMPTDNELLNLTYRTWISPPPLNLTQSLPLSSIVPTKSAQTLWQRVRECQCHGPPYYCSLQSAHKKDSHSQVLERGQADSYLYSIKNPENYRANDHSEWHAVQTVCHSVALYCSRLVWPTR